MSSIKIVKEPYLYENAFKADNGDIINYAQLRVDIAIGDTVCTLSKKLVGFEKEYIKMLIQSESAFNENDIQVD